MAVFKIRLGKLSLVDGETLSVNFQLTAMPEPNNHHYWTIYLGPRGFIVNKERDKG